VINEREGVKLSDNGFDLMPNDSKEVQMTGCMANELSWLYIGI
jgi:beta-mannosidase